MLVEWRHTDEDEGSGPEDPYSSAPVGPNGVGLTTPPDDAWQHWDATEDDSIINIVDDDDDAVGPNGVGLTTPPDDAWTFDDEAATLGVPDSYQQSGLTEVPQSPEWDWSDEVSDEWSESSALGLDAAISDTPQQPVWEWAEDAYDDLTLDDSPVGADAPDAQPDEAWVFDDDVPVVGIPDSYQQADAPVELASAIAWQFEDEGTFDEISADGPVGPDAVVVSDTPPAPAWDWTEEVADEWAESPPVGPDAVLAADSPPEDAWSFDDDYQIDRFADAYQQSDAAVAERPHGEPWLFDDDSATDDILADGPVGLDAAIVDQPPAEAWAFDDDIFTGSIPDSYQQSDAVAAVVSDALQSPEWNWTDDATDELVFDDSPVGADLPPNPNLCADTGPVFDGADEDLEELTIDDFANFDPEALADDAWDWSEDAEAWQPDEQVLGADAAVAVDAPPAEAWAFDDDIFTGSIPDSYQQSDAVAAERPHGEPWTFDDDAADEIIDDSPVGPDAVVVAGQPPDDAWTFDDDATLDEISADGPVGVDVADVPLSLDWEWEWAEYAADEWSDSAPLGPDAPVLSDGPSAEAWDWSEDAYDEWSESAPVGSDSVVLNDALPEDFWDWTEEVPDEWGESAPVGPDAVVVDGYLPDDAWNWNEADDDFIEFDSAPVASEPEAPPADGWVTPDEGAFEDWIDDTPVSADALVVQDPSIEDGAWLFEPSDLHDEADLFASDPVEVPQDTCASDEVPTDDGEPDDWWHALGSDQPVTTPEVDGPTIDAWPWADDAGDDDQPYDDHLPVGPNAIVQPPEDGFDHFPDTLPDWQNIDRALWDVLRRRLLLPNPDQAVVLLESDASIVTTPDSTATFGATDKTVTVIDTLGRNTVI